MDAERWSRVQELFEAALEQPADQRDAYLQAACRGEEDLCQEVRSLLDADTQVHSLLHGLAIDAVGLPGQLAAQEQPIGPYRILRRLGDGGMGTVYLAERDDGQFDQRVALKVIKRGMDTNEILRRFHTERQILARLQHPNIARLLDGGLTDDGRPYFAMEYVQGEPITRYCDRLDLSIRERLILFQHVCAAVQYAHQKLIVHRDLKPDNILVAEDGRVMLLDFGIAKLLDTSEEGSTLVVETRAGVRLMTPPYAAPEQVRAEPVTTATDVYALGILLYELLTGQRPYQLKGLTPTEIEQVICYTEPDRPSTVVGRLPGPPDAAHAEAAAPPSDGGSRPQLRLKRQLSGDLDTICLKALRKAPERRYPSVEVFQDDIHRHLAGLPVRARPDTLGYRTQKFIRRHRPAVLVAATAFFLLTGVIGLYTFQLIQERDRAQVEAAKAAQVASFLRGLFEVADPGTAQGETITARELLDRGATRIEQELSAQPEVQASMKNLIGDVYFGLGLYDRSATLLRDAVALRQQLHGDALPEVYESLGNLATTLREQGDLATADSLYRAVLDRQRRQYGEAHPDVARTLYHLAGIQYDQGRYEASEQSIQEALALQQRLLAPDHIDLGNSYHHWALLREEAGEVHAADSLYQLALSIQRRAMGDKHPDVANTLNNLSASLRHQGRLAEAEPYLREGLSIRRAVLGPDHPDVAHSLNHLGSLLQEMPGREVEAEAAFQEGLMIRRQAFGETHVTVGASLAALARFYNSRERYAESALLYQQALDVMQQAVGQEHTYVAGLLNSLAHVQKALGDAKAAEAFYRESLALHRRLLPAQHPNIAYPLTGLGLFLTEAGRPQEAEPYLIEGLDIRRKALPAGHWQIAVTENLLGACLAAQERFAAAEVLLLSSYNVLENVRGSTDRNTQRALEYLVDLYEAWGKPAQAATYRTLMLDDSVHTVRSASG